MKRADSTILNETLTEITGVQHFSSVQAMFEDKLSEKDPEFARELVKELQKRLSDRDKLLTKATRLLKEVSKSSETCSSEITELVEYLTNLGY